MSSNIPEAGSYLIKTQQEIDTIKKQLQKLKPHQSKTILLQNQYNSLNSHLHILESQISNANLQFYDQMINNFDITAQKLPTVFEKQLLKNTQSQQQLQAQVQFPNIDMMQSSVKLIPQVSVEPLGRSALKPKGLHIVKSAQTLSRKAFQNKKQQQLQIQSPDIGDAIIYKKGISQLLNQGELQKSQIYNILNPNEQIIQKSQLNLFDFALQTIKKPIQLESQSSQILFKVDLQSDDNKTIQKVPVTNQQNISKSNYSKGLQTKSSIQSMQFADNQRDITQSSKEAEPIFIEKQEGISQQKEEQWLPIINGQLIQDNHSFIEFQNKNYSNWNRINPILQSLAKIAQESQIQQCKVFSSKILELSKKMDSSKFLSIAQLVLCFENWEEIAEILNIASLIYKTKNGKQQAATKLQSYWKGYIARQNFLRLRIMVEKVIIIQRAIRILGFRRKVTQQIRKNNTFMLERFKTRQNVFQEEWPYIKIQKRYEIHINSCSFEEIKRLSMEKFPQRQNTQITRIFNLKDPMINIIYIAPYDLPNELIDYFYKILTLGDISDCRSRLHFLWPQNHQTFSSHMTITQQLIYSPKTIKRIKQLIKGFPVYIVPGITSNDDIKLSDALNVPLFSGIPQLHQYYSSKSGCKALLDELQLPQPLGIRNIYDEKELINSLSVLSVKNPQINTWILKIDDETQGRGIAWIEVKKMFRRLQPFDVQTVAQLLTKKLKKRLHFAYPSLFNSYSEFLINFTTRGGIIEACQMPTLSGIRSLSFSFKIEPDGEIISYGSYEKIKTNEVQTISCISPQQYLKIDMDFLSRTIGNKLIIKKMMGYFTVDCISFQNDNILTQNFQIIGLDCYLNQYSSSLMYFDFLMKGKLEVSSGQYIVDDLSKINNQRYMIYCPLIMNEGLDVLQYKTFFQLCRLESISFNLEKKIGSTFILIDSLQSGMISSLTVGFNVAQVIKYMVEALSFLQKNIGRGNDQINIDIRSDKINMMAIHQKLKGMLKKLESSEYKQYNSQYL